MFASRAVTPFRSLRGIRGSVSRISSRASLYNTCPTSSLYLSSYSSILRTSSSSISNCRFFFSTENAGAEVKATVAQIKAVRDRTGAAIIDCKKALESNGLDVDKAIQTLAAQSLSAVGREGRIVSEGIVGKGIGKEGRVAVLVEMLSETDFVAKMDRFRETASSIAQSLAEELERSVQSSTEALLKEHPTEMAEKMQINTEEKNLAATEMISQLIFETKETIKLRRVLSLTNARNGITGIYSHGIGKMVAVVSLTPNTDASSTAVKELADNIAIHLVACPSLPTYGPNADLSASIKDLCDQPFIMDESVTIGQALKQVGAELKSHALVNVASYENPEAESETSN